MKKDGSKPTPEEMHAMNVEDGDAECPNCTKFGKDECWTHSPHMYGKCKKRGKTCLCVKQARYLARKNGREKKATESEDKPKTAMASMMASMEALTVALNTKQNKSATTEGRTVTFET